jgi:origin recognition complex subunit 3
MWRIRLGLQFKNLYDSENDTDRILAEEYSPFHERDLPGGYVARFDLYRAAWKKCLDKIEVRFTFRPLCARIETRVQNIVSSIHAPIVDEIVRCVHRAYDDLLPGLPRVELPVIVISGMSLSA